VKNANPFGLKKKKRERMQIVTFGCESLPAANSIVDVKEEIEWAGSSQSRLVVLKENMKCNFI
jgi:hypothetical protein